MNKVGQYFTEKKLARYVIFYTLKPIMKNKIKLERIKIIDPSCGNGIFLIEACKLLSKLTGLPKRLIAEKCIYGIDINKKCCKKTIKKMKKKCGHSGNIGCCDFLFDMPENFPKKFDCVVGNPPFLGGNKISTVFDAEYYKKLKTKYRDGGGTIDYCAYFFRKSIEILTKNGVVGLIATKTIAQTKTRKFGLQSILHKGYNIYKCDKNIKWHNADVIVHIIYFTKLKNHKYNSFLHVKPERPDPVRLAANASLSFQGSIVLGMGFTLTPEEREALIARDPKNGERIFPYLGGEEVNTSPTQDFHRYVINFGQMSLEEAEKWPDLIEIVRGKVKPERDKLRDTADGRRLKLRWWEFCRTRPELYRAIQDLPRCLVTSCVSKHVIFSFQKANRVFSHKLYVFPFSDFDRFSVLQSRIHVLWTLLLSSTLGQTLNYSATDCFKTFPFPDNRQLRPTSQLERIGRRLYQTRARFMVNTAQGLTQTYNLLKDPNCNDPRIIDLRQQHGEMDRAVLAAYGWDDLAVPPYGTPTSDAETRALADFRDEVIDRLFVLNAERSKQQ